MQGLNLAVIGNCAIASLVRRDGTHPWFCFPRLDGDPVFCSLVGGETPENGFMDVQVREMSGTAQSYVPNTAILETVITDKSGARIKLVDFAPRFERYGRTFRPPLLVRRIVPLQGRPRVRVRIRPRFNYGTISGAVSIGSNHVRFVGPSSTLRVTSDMPTSYILDETEFVLDRPLTLFVGADEPIPENPDTLAQSFLAETYLYWQRWVRGLSLPFEWQEEVVRSAITLKLCSYEDTGAIVAALTTSIPEAPSTERNWDYRYCWMRDAFFTVGALNRLGATRTMERFIRFVIDVALGDHDVTVAPLYPITSGTPVEERIAEGLPGYGGMGPVRVGNAAVMQVQNDVYGSIILTASQMFWDTRLSGSLDGSLYQHLRSIGVTAAKTALQPDAGPWEYRGRKTAHTYSAVMCWAGIHRLSMIAEKVGETADAAHWRSQANALRAEILRRATTPQGWISGALDSEVADASSLLLPEVGFLQSNDVRMGKTIDLVGERLMHEGFAMRYSEADDFGRPETAFLICTFWYVDALALAGRRSEAREVFTRALACRNHVGLLSEDFDPRTGLLWGNFPQAYSHVGLIHSAARLSRSWEEALWRAS
ncbi:MAG: glycoside hydrolase family 15 protein [Alphaproteobacteria bacterium]|nr:glycoside hydrolase family 15 protein [Alphaproteobacteria bacterium]